MKVLLVNSPTREHPIVRDMAGGLGFDGGSGMVLPPLDLAYIAAGLIAAGHSPEIIDADAKGLGREEVHALIRSKAADAMIATVSLPLLYADCAFVRQAGSYFNGRILVKTGVSYPPILKEILEKSGAVSCIFGECELAAEAVIAGRERRGTAWLENGEFRSGGHLMVEDLDSLPLPARGLLDNKAYTYSLLGPDTTVMQTSRGCPFPCAYYCAYPMVQGKVWRHRSPGHVVREMEDAVRVHGVRNILFRDATFTMDRERTLRICDLILAAGLKVNWWCETRVDRLDAELMGRMREAGCAGMNIGVESGDPEVMETQAKIGLTMAKLRAVRDKARELGLKLHFLLMVGLPRETRMSALGTYRLVRELRPETIGVTILTPYPGTPFYSEAKEKGWIETEDWSEFGGHRPVMHTDAMSGADMLFAQRMLGRLFGRLSARGPAARLKTALLELRFMLWARLGI
jgi:radical SAM superfamily enzyme YgiQ (UPF0313 family)